MAFITVPTSIIESGDPVTQELFDTYVKDNLDDHESRLVSLEGGSAVAYEPLYWNITGPYENSVPLVWTDGFIRLNFNITLLAGRLTIATAGSSGTTEIDFLYKRGAGAWTSVFSTKPSVGFAAGNMATSTNAIFSTTALLTGDFIRMHITTTQAGGPLGLLGFLEYEKT